jgi:hypothetical protein
MSGIAFRFRLYEDAAFLKTLGATMVWIFEIPHHSVAKIEELREHVLLHEEDEGGPYAMKCPFSIGSTARGSLCAM